MVTDDQLKDFADNEIEAEAAIYGGLNLSDKVKKNSRSSPSVQNVWKNRH